MSGLPWFRVKTCILGDEILGLLDFEHRWHFMALLACKGSGLLDREYPSPEIRERALAKKLDLDVDQFRAALAALIEVGLVDETGQPKKWEKHQASVETSAARTRKYRDKKAVEEPKTAVHQAPAPVGDACDSHSDVTCDNGDVTCDNGDICGDARVRHSDALDIDRDKDKEVDQENDAALPPRAGALDEPLQWVQHFVARHGFKFHEAQTSTTMPMFRRWVDAAVTIEQVDDAFAIAANRFSGPLRSPAYLEGIVTDLIVNSEVLPIAVSGGGRRTQQPRHGPASRLSDDDFAHRMLELAEEDERDLRVLEHDPGDSLPRLTGGGQ